MTRINMQQPPKVAEVLSTFRARPGHVLLDSDVRALEPSIVAYFSRDPGHLEVFASGRPHDVYLFVAMGLWPDRRDELAAVYQPGGVVTTDTVAAAKVHFKAERRIAKELHLAAGYGASANRMYQAMRVKGVRVTLEEVRVMRGRYWELFAGVKRWERALLAEREDRGGWIYNGRGRPLAIADDKVKDIVNTFVQSTGHDCLLTLVWYIDRLRRERGVRMWPWLVDFHDQTTWEVAAADVDAARQVFADAYQQLNAELAADIPLTGGIDVGTNLWEFKQ